MAITLDGSLGIDLPGNNSDYQLGSSTNGTEQNSTSGTSIDFTNIPSWVKRITLMFNGVSTSGTSNYLIQIGDSGGVATTGYTAASSTINFDILTQSVLYYTSSATGNFTINFRGNAGQTFNNTVAIGTSVSATFLNTNGSTPYYNSAVTIDGVSVTPKWQGGVAPAAGNASAIDVYTYAIIKTAASTFTVLAAVSKFA